VKIAKLELKAFGPFTDRTLHLGPGLHIVHGPNEAGKSSTLRALKAWLFGFPERTHDNFLHANEQLLVGGCLQAEDGRELAFYRRKKRKADVLDPEGNPIEAGILAGFLPIAEQAVFESLYGLSHEDLIRGGEDILAQKGEIGQALFSAGAGISSLRGVLTGLESEAEALFKARGAKQEINEALAAYRETQRIVREASLSSREWQELNNGLTEAQEALLAIEKQQGEKERRRRQLERIHQLLPQLALRNALRLQLAELGEVVVLPDDFFVRRLEVERALHTLSRREADLAGKLAQRKKIAAVSPYQEVLEAEAAIEELQQRLGGYNKAREDQPNLEGMRISCKREAAEFLRMVRQDISLEQVEILRPVSGRRKIVADLATRHKGLQEGLAQAERDLRDIQREIKLIDEEVARLPQAKETAGLLQLCRLARKGGAIDEDLSIRAKLVEDKKRGCHIAIDRLSLWSGDLSRFLALRLPLPETVRKFEEFFQIHDERQRDIQKERERLHKRLKETQASIRQLETSGNTPTEEELIALRSQRDLGWELLRRQWLKGEDLAGEDAAFGQDLPLPEAYEKKVLQADTLADRLRHEADRVQAFAALRGEERNLTGLLAELKNEEDQIILAFNPLAAEWRILWEPCSIIPLSPKEMLAWLAEAGDLRRSADELLADERELARKSHERQELRNALAKELAALSDGLPVETGEDKLEPFILQGEAVLSRVTALEEKRSRLLEKRVDLLKNEGLIEGRKADFFQAQKAWQREWQEVAGELGGGREILPAEAGDLLDNLHSCFNKLREAEDLRKRIDGIARDTQRFEEDTLALTERLFPASINQPAVINHGGSPQRSNNHGTSGHRVPQDVVPCDRLQPASEIVAQLKTLLNQARTERTLREGYLEKEKQEAEEALLLAGERKDLEHQRAELCRLAGRILPEELEAVEKRSARYRSLAASLAQTENILLEGAGGLTLAELEAQTAKIDPDTLPEEVGRLSQEIELELAPEGKRLSVLIGEKKNQLRQMDGNARAAEAAEQGAQLLAKIRRLAERYIQLKVAGYVLKSEVERYRSENQTPVLAITSRFFRELTLGSFSGLLTDENDKGDPVLIGTRPNGARVLVERMSSGTRDQLYLALRLASLEWRLAGHEPMPFILDDILVNADDARSKAALKILGELAARTQVILFTHHRRIIEEARQLAAVSGILVHEHELGG
jgi:uncharacterized protein YhaN